MRLIVRIFIVFLIGILLASCSYKFDVILKENSSEYKKRFETAIRIDELNEEKLDINTIHKGIEIKDTSIVNHFLIINNTSEDVFIEYEKSSMITNNMSYRVISGEQRDLEVSKIIPDRIVAAGTEAEVSFYNASSVEDSSSFDKVNISYRIADKSYRIEKFRTLRFVKDIEKIGTVEYVNVTHKILCYTTALFYGGYCWFIKYGDPEEEDYKGAKSKAAAIYKLSEKEFNVVLNEED